MTEQPSQTHAPAADALTSALQAVIAAEPGAVNNSGQLRVLLASHLGEHDAHVLRGPLHHVVAAAEERLPATLTSLAPLSQAAIDRVASSLADNRRWRVDAAQSAVDVWMAALGLTVAPPSDRAVATGLPLAAPSPHETTAGSDVRIDWPSSSKRLRSLAVVHGRTPSVAQGQAYAGLHVAVYAALVSLLLIGITVALLLLPEDVVGRRGGPVAIIGIGAALGLSLLLKRGLLMVKEEGLAFVQFDARMHKPKLTTWMTAPWSDVSVQPGRFAKVRLGETELQLGLRGGALAEAIARRAAGERR